MATKTARPSSKTSSPAHKSSGRSQPPSKASTGGKAAAGKGRTARAGPSKKPQVRPAHPRAGRRTLQQPYEGLSLDRKLDIVGVILTFVGLITLLSLLSPADRPLTGDWVILIHAIFGTGKYVLPFGLIAGGLWLVLRNFERIPTLAPERAIGFILLYANLLASLHLGLHLWNGTAIFDLVQQQYSGGYVGALAIAAFQGALGLGGTFIALAAWLLIALALAFDVTVWEMMAWFRPLSRNLREAFALLAARLNRLGGSPQGAGGQPMPDLTPLPQHYIPGVTPPLVGVPPIPPNFTGLEGYETSAGTQGWILPPVSQILDEGLEATHDDDIDRQRAGLIEETLESFGAPARVIEINRGPTITQFGVEPDFLETRNGRIRVRVGKIASLADDLALALSARTIRVQAPVPGKGFVGIEVPNDEINPVMLRDVLESEAFDRIKSPLGFALGQNVSGLSVAADLASMPHLLVAGATGSGKSVCVNALISCLLLNNSPDQLRMIMVDPKRVELTGYNGIPHLLAPVVVEMEKVVAALQWVTREMDLRYRKMSENGVRNIAEYNNRAVARGLKSLPYLVVIIDELADLMMLAPDETERTVTRLAQLARATGIHLVIATQRPSTDVVTGLIKANFPARIAFAVASMVDSRVILDQPGAERLLGRGDMLFQAPDAPAPVRLQGVFVSDNEIFRLVNFWRAQVQTGATNQVDDNPPDQAPAGLPLRQMPMWEDITTPQENSDPLLHEAIDLVRRQGRASVSMLQRRFRIGYTRAARLVEVMEDKGIVGPPESGTGTRPILDYGPAAPPIDEQGD